ncbi:hypothetical protein AgCh_010953 [Apium graveolens]
MKEATYSHLKLDNFTSFRTDVSSPCNLGEPLSDISNTTRIVVQPQGDDSTFVKSSTKECRQFESPLVTPTAYTEPLSRFSDKQKPVNDHQVNSSNLSRRIDSSVRAVPYMALFQENICDIDYESAEHSTIAEFEGDYFDFFHDDDHDTACVEEEILENGREAARSVPEGYVSLGSPTEFCRKCKVVMWKEERTNKNVKKGVPKFSFCCLDGQIKLPRTPTIPSYLMHLYTDPKKKNHFMRYIRLYNAMFAFTSMGGKVDHTINCGRAPCVYRLNGQNHHIFGTLIPNEGDDPKLCQLYVYDTEHEVDNRIKWVKVDSGELVDSEIVEGLVQMLDESLHIRLAGRIYQQYVVDAFSYVEQARLWWLRTHQTNLRSDMYNSLAKKMVNGVNDTTNVGKGHPDVFLTMTCNPLWDEILEMMKLLHGCSPRDSPDIIARVFHLKLEQLLDDIKKKNYFGTCIGVMYVVEFQKRGLPHVHMLIWLDRESKMNLASNVDKFVSVEIPDPLTDPVGYDAGHDRATIEISTSNGGLDDGNDKVVDEINAYFDGERSCTFTESESLEKVVRREQYKHSQLEAFFLLNESDVNARKYTYDQIPQYYVWNETDGKWSLQTVNGVHYSTFKDACKSLGLLDDDNEWHVVMKECVVSSFPAQIRQLFVHIIVNCQVTDMRKLWDDHWKHMIDDILLKRNELAIDPNNVYSDKQLQFFALAEIDKLLKSVSKSLKQFRQLPQPPSTYLQSGKNNLVIEETSYNLDEMDSNFKNLFQHCNTEQLQIFKDVVHVSVVLEKDKLTGGNNFLDWQRNLRIVLRQERKLHVIDIPPPGPLPEGATTDERAARTRDENDANDVACLMLATMSAELQRQHVHMDAYTINEHLQSMFASQTRQERFNTSKSLFNCKQGASEPVGPHVLKMIGYIEYLETLGFPIGPETGIYLIMNSLNNKFTQFVVNYNMNEFDKTPTELLHMLRTYETNMKTAEPAPILMVGNKGKAKGKGKWKGKKKIGSDSTPMPKSGPKQALKPKGGVAKGECHYCKKDGHWKRNYPIYLEDLKKKKAVQISGSGPAEK